MRDIRTVGGEKEGDGRSSYTCTYTRIKAFNNNWLRLVASRTYKRTGMHVYAYMEKALSELHFKTIFRLTFG